MSPLRQRFRAFQREQSGAAALEFALVFPVLMLLVFGVIGFSMLGSAISGMHFAAQEGARCFAVNKVTCATTTTAATFARARYIGPDVNPVFVASNSGCGFTVTGTATFELSLALTSFNVPVSASACYPGKPA